MKKKKPNNKVPAELTGGAIVAWKHYTTELMALDQLHTSDRAALITLCRATALKELAAASIDADGSVITLPNNYPGPNPYLKVFFEAAKLERALQIEFGLTCRSRKKIKPQETAPASDTELPF